MRANQAIPLSFLSITVVFLVSCGEPKLAQDQTSDEARATKPGIATLPKEERDAIEAIRAELAGQRFHTLTLAGKKFSTVQLHEINDEAICFSHAGGDEMIAWSDVDAIVKEKWGFDPIAYKAISQVADASSPQPTDVSTAADAKAKEEYYAMLVEKEKKEKALEAEREALYESARNLRAELSLAKIKLRNLEQGRMEVESGFNREDIKADQISNSRYDEVAGNDRFGGVSTSKADRNKALEKWKEKIQEARDKVDTVTLKLEETEKRLSLISRKE